MLAGIRIGAASLTVSVAILLAACAPAVGDASTPEPATPEEEVWTLDPILTPDGIDPGGARTDLLVPLHLFDDTAGGFWANSGSAWLHFAATGELTNRVDWAVPESPWVLTGRDAATPTRIAVGAVWSDGDLFGDILLLDMVTNEQSVVLHQERPIGNLAVIDDTVVFLSYAAGETDSFEVSRVSLTTGERQDLATLQGSGATADVDVGMDGTIYVASELANVVMSSDGTVLTIVDRRTMNPQVAVSPAGHLMWMNDTATTATPFRVDGGSSHARAIIARNSTCGHEHISVVREGNRDDLAALCQAAGVVWLGNDAIVVSVGSEDGAPLIKVVPPARAGSEDAEN